MRWLIASTTVHDPYRGLRTCIEDAQATRYTVSDAG
jgi:hypothetical protein